MSRLHRRKAFTLIEILIAITILLAISFMGVLKYANMVEENNIKIDIINAKTIADGIHIAILSDAIDGTDVNQQPIDNDKLEPYFDTKITPKSKAFGGKNKGTFTYSISGKKISIHANNKELYPTVSPDLIGK